jgi:hypothetical protein
MEPSTQILLSGALTFGVPLALAVRELLMLRRTDRAAGGRWGEAGSPRPGPVPGRQGGGDPVVALRPLPDCLVPKAPARDARAAPGEARELEPA